MLTLYENEINLNNVTLQRNCAVAKRLQILPSTAPGRGESAAYAAGSFGTGVFSTVPTILLLYFCTEILRLPPSWATAIVFVPKVWSIVWDPFVGAWSDRTSTRLGRRRPFLIAGTTGVTLSFIAVFSPPRAGLTQIALWVAVAYFLLATLYSLFAVPYVAIPAEIGGHREVRARLIGWRMVIAMLGILTGAGVVPLVVEAGGGGRNGYGWMSIWVAGACALAMTGPIFMLRGRDRWADRSGGAPPKIWRNLWRALAEPRFLALAGSYLLQLTAVGIISAATPYLVTRSFGRNEAAVGTAMLLMLVVTTLMIPAWSWTGRRFGEMRSLMAGVVGYAVLTMGLGMLAIAHAPWSAVLVAYAMMGVPFAAMQVLPFTIVAHLIHSERERGRAAEGSFTGVWTGTEKLGLALGPAITGLVLWLSPGPATGSLAMLTMIGPALLTLTSLALLRSIDTQTTVLSPTGLE